MGPILFSPTILHKDVAEGKTVTSAGFVRLDTDMESGEILVECQGQSVSLGISSANGDADMIATVLNM